MNRQVTMGASKISWWKWEGTWFTPNWNGKLASTEFKGRSDAGRGENRNPTWTTCVLTPVIIKSASHRIAGPSSYIDRYRRSHAWVQRSRCQYRSKRHWDDHDEIWWCWRTGEWNFAGHTKTSRGLREDSTLYSSFSCIITCRMLTKLKQRLIFYINQQVSVSNAHKKGRN